MSRTRQRSLLAVTLFAAVMYVLMSFAVAVSTANKCNASTAGHKSWVFAPPHWECAYPSIRIGG